MPELEAAKLEELLAMYEQGVRVEDIAKELELPLSRVRKELTAHGRKRTRSASRSDEAEICRAYSDGEMVADILARHGLTYPMLYTVLGRNGIPIRKVANQEGRKVQLQVAVEMYQAGSPLWQIQRDTGIAQPTLHARLHELNLPLRRPRK